MSGVVHIVDDNHEVRAAASFMLRQYGFQTRLYSGGAEFLAQQSLDRGCVLLDVEMPEMDGFDILAELDRRRANIPAIILTGHGDVTLAVQAMKRGAIDFLEKPYDARELIEAIERALALSASARKASQATKGALELLQRLTPREAQVLQGLRAGMANKTIARWLGLSPRTVEAYRATMMSKLGVSRMSLALGIAIDGGLPLLEEEKGSGSS